MLFPVGELLSRPEDFITHVCVTAQHRELLDQVTKLFQIRVDYDLDVMVPNQSLEALTSRLIERLEAVLRQAKPDVVLVQGDTTTTLAASLVSFYAKVPVAHVEAGLRTSDPHAPFPEEINRRLTTQLADLHFAPTAWARDNLCREGISPESIHVTGNTIVDTLLKAKAFVEQSPPVIEELAGIDLSGKKLLLLTMHRRENFGSGIANICRALRQIVGTRTDVEIVFPVHPNPNVRKPVEEYLAGVKQLHLIGPQSYLPFVWLMSRARLVLTDSGGVQEEMPTFGQPVLVLREKTERPEGVEAGVCQLVGTDTEKIVQVVNRLLDAEPYGGGTAKNPFGDGKASVRIADRLIERYVGKYQQRSFIPSFSVT